MWLGAKGLHSTAEVQLADPLKTWAKLEIAVSQNGLSKNDDSVVGTCQVCLCNPDSSALDVQKSRKYEREHISIDRLGGNRRGGWGHGERSTRGDRLWSA